jgi:hypothetical protein
METILKPLGYVSRFLGMASVLLGSALALTWGLAFVLIAAHVEFQHATAPNGPAGEPLGLPIEPPLAGLALGGLGWLIGRLSREPVAWPSLAGLVANAIPLILALVLVAIHSLS